jgi:YggT family protein
VASVILLLLQLYVFVLLGRAIFSWFPPRPGSALGSVNHLLYRLTEPVLRPVRRVVPRIGMFDLSFMVVLIGIFILQQLVASAAVR